MWYGRGDKRPVEFSLNLASTWKGKQASAICLCPRATTTPKASPTTPATTTAAITTTTATTEAACGAECASDVKFLCRDPSQFKPDARLWSGPDSRSCDAVMRDMHRGWPEPER